MPLVFDLTPDGTLDFKGSKEVAVRVTYKYKSKGYSSFMLPGGWSKNSLPMIVFQEANGKLPKKLVNAYDERTGLF